MITNIKGIKENLKTYELVENFLNIQDRKLDYSLETDRAYLRLQFKKFLKANKGEVLRVQHEWDCAYSITLTDEYISTIDGLNKVFSLIDNIVSEEPVIYGIKLA